MLEWSWVDRQAWLPTEKGGREGKLVESISDHFAIELSSKTSFPSPTRSLQAKEPMPLLVGVHWLRFASSQEALSQNRCTN